MSESFLNEIAEQLNAENQNAVENTEQAPEQVPEQTTEQVEEQPEAVQEKETFSDNEQVEQTSEEPKQEETPWWEREDEKLEPQETVSEKKEEPAREDFVDEDIKLLMEYKKSGKSLADFVKEYKIEDYNSWDDKKIVSEGLKEFMNLSEEEMEQAQYEFENASVFQKKQWADSFKQKFEQKNEGRLKELTKSNTQMEEYQKAVAEKYNAELNQMAKNYVGKEVYGLKITDEMSGDLKNYIDKEFTLQRADGSFDVEKMFSVALWLKYGKDLVKANITKAKNEGKEQVIKEVTNPSKNMTGGGRSVGSGLEAAQEAFNALFQS